LPQKIGVYFFEIKNLLIDSAILFFDIFGNNFKKVPPTVWLRAKISELVEKRTTEKVSFSLNLSSQKLYF